MKLLDIFLLPWDPPGKGKRYLHFAKTYGLLFANNSGMKISDYGISQREQIGLLVLAFGLSSEHNTLIER